VAPVVFVIAATVPELGIIWTGLARVVTSFATQKYEVDDVKPFGNVMFAAFAARVDSPT